MTTLLILMALDYVSGMVVAWVFKKSPKTEHGGAESRAGFKGIIRKVFMIFIVAVGFRLDLILGSSFIRDGVAIAFSVNEILSLIENAGLMGIPIPSVILKGVEVLKAKGEKNEK